MQISYTSRPSTHERDSILRKLRTLPFFPENGSSRVSRRGDPNAEQPPLEVRNVYRFCIRLQIRLALSLSLSLNGGPRNADEPSRDCAQTFIALIPLQKEPLCLLRSSDLADCNLSHGPPSQSFGKVARSATPPPQTLPARSTLLRTLSRELGRTRLSPGFGAERKPSHCTGATYADFAYVHELRGVRANSIHRLTRAPPLDEARALSARASLLLREHRELSTEHQLLQSSRA